MARQFIMSHQLQLQAFPERFPLQVAYMSIVQAAWV